MSLSISAIIKENEDFIISTIQQMELALDSSDSNDEELLRRAIFSVRNKYINFDKYVPSKSILELSIIDVRPAKVFVNFKEKEIVCDCKKDGWCRHKVSTVLALYQQIDSLQDWVSNWRAKKTLSLESLASNRTPNNWNQLVKSVFSQYVKENQKLEGNLLSPLMNSILSKLMNYLPYEREWKAIYKLYMEVGIFNVIWEHVEKTESSIEIPQFDEFLHNQIKKIEGTSEDLKGNSRLFATDPFFDELQTMVRDILLHRLGFEERKYQLYLIFWNNIFTEKRRIQNEMEMLQEYKDPSIDTNLVMNIFYLLLKDEESLRKNLQQMKESQLAFYFQLAEIACKRKNSHYGEWLLMAMLPYLHDYLHEQIVPQNRKFFVQKIHSLYEELELSEEEESTLFTAYGFYGLAPYSDYLLKKKRFNEWSALQQLYPSSISHLEKVGLKIVLEEEPKALLPLFHFYAMVEIEQKTRMNYKEAAMILKKMKAACQRAGKINFWKDYIQQIQSQFKRLKAFQQELNKEQLL